MCEARFFAVLLSLVCCGHFCRAGAAAHESWSLQPLRKGAVPIVSNGWPRTPIDSFVLATLCAKGLSPAPEADKRSLARRVYFDLIGLPPSPETVDAFLADESPLAYEHMVDALLASPRYGERWARHWMDTVHFAETHGHDQDRIRTNAWPYRDYLISSFNSDKPYARFVQEQVAGDVMFSNDPQATVALGFLAAGPWDESSLRDIREDTVDREIARYLDRDDIVATTMSTFTSTTVHCARCHQHKFDPVSQEDYYSLQAVFAATDKADRFYDSNPALHVKRQTLLRTKAMLAQNDEKRIVPIMNPPLEAEASAWLNAIRERRAAWQTIRAAEAKSTQGATLTQRDDGSIYSTGIRPEKDTYTIVATNLPANVRAIRLEVLADPSLPHSGPGRQDNGNLHLSEFRVIGASNASASADFNQDGWTIQHAVDGNLKTAWGIYPKVGQSHYAVFTFKQPLSSSHGATLRIELDQQHGGGHLIGRFRLAVATNDSGVDVLPDAIARAVDTEPDKRTAQQRSGITRYFLEQKTERELQVLPPPQKVYAGASDFVADGSHKPARVPRPIHVLKRGEISKRGELASPGALSCVQGLPARFALANERDEGSRRRALAEWITHQDNPLTWRSIVNRVWQYHFGRGIVDTPNDLGVMGGAPSHPELLDWLAATFRDGGGSIKRLNRMIVLSAAYRQSTRYDAASAAIDGDNRLLWRMNRARLDAESIRDSILQMTGSLNLKMGGPSFRNFGLSPGIHVTPKVDYGKCDFDDPEQNRRSVYRFLFRTLPEPFMDTLDCPNGSQLTPTRTVSFTALQAMALLNNPFIASQSEKMAERLAKDGSGLDVQIDRVCRLAWGRPPTKAEKRDFHSYAERRGMANLSRLIWNSNEFIFVN